MVEKEVENDSSKKRTHNDKTITEHVDGLENKNKKQKTTLNIQMEKYEEKKEMDVNNTNTEKNTFSLEAIFKFINLSWMKRMDQYVTELAREKKTVPTYLTDVLLSALEQFTSVEDIFNLMIQTVNLHYFLVIILICG